MKSYEDHELEMIENNIIDTIDGLINDMDEQSKIGLLEMLTGSLTSMLEECK